MASAAFMAGCGDSPRTTRSSTGTAIAAPTWRFAEAGRPERVVATKSLVMWMHVSGERLLYLDTVEPQTEALVSTSLDGRATQEEIARGGFTRLIGAGKAVILFDREEQAQLVDVSTKAARALGPAQLATFREGTIYVARPAPDDTDIALEAIAAEAPAQPRPIATIARGGKLSRSVNAMVATASGLFVAVEEANDRGIRNPSHIFRIPISGGAPEDVATVVDLHDLQEIGGKVFIGSLAKAHVLEGSNVLTPIPDTYWDVLATDGKVAYFAIATSMPEGGIGGWLHAWAPPARSERIYGEMHDPSGLALSDTHVYWSDGTRREILRLARVER